jgi:glycosyltransferase involved in cell wall biosynthesis
MLSLVTIQNITPLIITLNEAPNIQRTLDKLVWAQRIVVIDSGSTDATLEILSAYPQVVVISRRFDDFASQCNFGLEQVQTSWVLSLDADYELSAELVDELATLPVDEATAGFRARFIYRIFGRSLRASLYPPRVVLYRRSQATYHNEGHGHRVAVSGDIRSLTGLIYHDDRKPLSRWFASQQRYAAQEADYLLSRNRDELRGFDRIRRAGWPAPIIVWFHTLLVKRCLFDGWPGWYYVLQRVLAETMIALEIIDQRLRRNS